MTPPHQDELALVRAASLAWGVQFVEIRRYGKAERPTLPDHDAADPVRATWAAGVPRSLSAGMREERPRMPVATRRLSDWK